MARWLARALAVLLVALACATPARAAGAIAGSGAAPLAAPGGQLRAYWVDAFGDGLYTQAQIDQLVADVKAANFNAIVAQVVRRGDCLCNRSSLPRTAIAGVSPAPFDPLESLIDAAHAQGIQVHAWIITTGIWQGPAAPTDPAHAYNQHGPSATGAANWIDYRSDGASHLNDEYFIDPGHPDAAQYIVNMATSIASAYNVDGINLDRIRYPDGNLGTNVPSWGYNPTAIARFQAATGRTDRPANTDPAWTQWRRDQVTNIVRKIYLETYAIRPSIRISADTISYGSGPQSVGGWSNTRTYAEVLQDWVGWLREGILDLNIVMNYKRDTDASQRSWYAQWSDFAKDNQFLRASAIGSALYLNDIASSVRQARAAVAASTAGAPSAGWAGYSYRTPDTMTAAGTRSGAASRTELLRGLTQVSPYDPVTPAVFASSATVPAMPWKDQPSFGQLRGTALDAAGAPIAQAAVTLTDGNGNVIAQRTTDGSGWFGFVDVLPGSYRVTIDSARAAASNGAVAVAA
ncbi:MAG TPA: family 10 glycosylhydrolase, partial [Candidatus Limnocylindria bacterium]|nr:family 10 glycosylhydrolase [Candidatus Limnocylindria bacterium]